MTKRTKVIIGVCAVSAIVGAVGAKLIINHLKNNTHKEPALESAIAAEEEPFGNIIESEDEFIYHKFDEGDLAIAGVKGLSGDVEMPRTYQGAVVTHIASGAFKDNTELKKITIGYPLMIEFNAFQNSSITEVVIKDDNGLIPETAVGFSPYCFADCKELKSFYCEAYMPGVEPYMFSGCTSLETVTLITPAVEITDYAFRDCSSLTEIELPGTIQYISETAFEGCDKLQTIKGFNGSYVETWAKEQGYTWVGEDVVEE